MRIAIILVKIILGIFFLAITVVVGALFLIPVTLSDFKREEGLV